MARTVVYDSRPVQAKYAEELGTKQRKTPGARRAARKKAERDVAKGDTAAETPADAPEKDGYLAKIAKYVPAESITLTTLGFAAFDPSGGDVWFLVAAGAVANVVYLYSTALSTRDTTPPPRGYFYVLACVAFVLWSLAVIDAVGSEAGISGDDAATQETFVLALAAFIVPALDTICSQLDLRLKK